MFYSYKASMHRSSSDTTDGIRNIENKIFLTEASKNLDLIYGDASNEREMISNIPSKTESVNDL